MHVVIFYNSMSMYRVAKDYEEWLKTFKDKVEIVSTTASDSVLVVTYKIL